MSTEENERAAFRQWLRDTQRKAGTPPDGWIMTAYLEGRAALRAELAGAQADPLDTPLPCPAQPPEAAK